MPNPNPNDTLEAQLLRKASSIGEDPLTKDWRTISGMAGTTIGEGAVPLDDYAGYLRKVAGTVIGDLGAAARKPMSQLYTGAKNILGNVMTDPDLSSIVQTEELRPGFTAKSLRLRPDPEEDKSIIQALVEAFHPSYLEK